MDCGVSPGLMAAPFFGIFIALMVVLVLVPIFLFKLFLWWRIFSKAGYSGAFGLLLLAPFGTLIMLCILAFSKWPAVNKPVQQV